jgi:hypothetical protein
MLEQMNVTVVKDMVYFAKKRKEYEYNGTGEL